MPAVIAVMLVVACEPDLLRCAPVFHWDRIWSSVENCRLDREVVRETVARRHEGRKTVMTRCRLWVDENAALRRTLRPGPSERRAVPTS